MPEMFWLFVALGLSGLQFWMFFQIMVQRPGFDWLCSPAVSVPVGVFGAFLVFTTLGWVNMGPLRILLLMGLWIPCGLVAFIPFGHKTADLISGSGSIGLRNIPSYDQARAAEKRHDFREAEVLFLQTFEEARRRQYPEADCAEGQLAYGNLLQRLGRLPEAAAWWEKAANGNLLADLALTSALRAADVWRELGDREHARQILECAIERFPRDPVTPTLRQRLRLLSSPAVSLESGKR